MSQDVMRRRRPRWLVPAAVAVVVVLVAGAALGYHLLTRPDAGELGTPARIAAKLNREGAECERFAPDDQEGHAERRGACWVNGEKVIISTFGSHQEVEGHWQRQLAVTEDNETLRMVIGEKFTISGEATAYLRLAAEVLKAELRTN